MKAVLRCRLDDLSQMQGRDVGIDDLRQMRGRDVGIEMRNKDSP